MKHVSILNSNDSCDYTSRSCKLPMLIQKDRLQRRYSEDLYGNADHNACFSHHILPCGNMLAQHDSGTTDWFDELVTTFCCMET